MVEHIRPKFDDLLVDTSDEGSLYAKEGGLLGLVGPEAAEM